MPVTVRPSKQFYDRFGEQATHEIAEWFSEMSTDYRAQLQELNDRNFARLEAKLDVLARDMKVDLADRFTAHTRWMMGGWAIVLGTLIAAWFRK